jgi:uncharacterized membrane protein YebE (DUF533 family)
MALFRLAALATLGYLGYKYYEKTKHHGDAAFAHGQETGENFSKVREAGPHAMADKQGGWTAEDEASDQSFPASDPPGTY